MASPQQARRSKIERDYAKFGPEYLASHEMCEAAVSWQCRGFADQVHHRRRRSQGGALCLPLNVLAVCEPCHTHIHNNVADSRRSGFLLGAGDADYEATAQPRKELA